MDKKKLFTVMSLAIGLGTLTVLSDNTKINVSATDTSSVQKFGDINNDGFVDTVDATAVLIEYAHLSTSGKGTFTEVQTKNADIDNNGLVDAVDSAYILSYYAYVSAGGNTGFREWADEKINSSRPSTTTTTQSVQTTVSNSTTTTTTTTTVSGISKVSEIRLSKTEMKIEVGKTDISYVTMLPESATNKDEIWTSSDEKVATVDKWGNVKGVADGVCTVTVTSVDNPTVKAEIKVTVGKGNTNKVSEIKLSKTEMSIEIGKTDISYVTMLPESATNKDEIWTSSDEKVATVDKWGNVKGVADGVCTVTVTSVDNPTVKAEIKVTVGKGNTNKVSEIKLSKTEMKIEVGKTDISYVTMLPESATNKDEVWTSSDEKVATVDKWGNVKGVADGVCTVTVTSVDNPTVKAEIKVTVGKGNANKVSEIKLSKTEMKIEVGKTDISYVTMLPESATNKDEVWTSSDEKVATVDKWGNVKGVADGVCTVTVTSVDNPTVKAEIKVTVGKGNANKVSEIKLSKTEMKIEVGKTDISYVTMLPESATNKDEVWTSSDEKVATVDKWGNVKGVADGVCTVTVTSVDSPTVKAEIKVTVGKGNANKVSEIKLSKTEMSIEVGKTDISYVTMLPESATNKDEVWTSSDEKVATVDKWGNVKGIAEGVCTVTVTSADNPTVKAEIKVTVGKGNTHNFQQINGLTYVDGILVANKSYVLPSTYSPEMDATTIQQFNLLSKAAANEGLNIYLSSGYRSYSQQDAIYNNYVSWYGQAQADTFSARPGHSEHQTGLAIDVNTIDDSFAGTPEAIWLENHAHEYGFIIRYPKGKESITGYKYEPWHIRYLGVEKATDVYNSGLTLEEYLGIDSYYH